MKKPALAMLAGALACVGCREIPANITAVRMVVAYRAGQIVQLRFSLQAGGQELLSEPQQSHPTMAGAPLRGTSEDLVVYVDDSLAKMQPAASVSCGVAGLTTAGDWISADSRSVARKLQQTVV